MTSFFPDVNVWLALSYDEHIHHGAAMRWLLEVPAEDRVWFSRFTQLGLLRLVANEQVMKSSVLTVSDALAVYDRWLEDPRIEWAPEPHGIDVQFRQACAPFSLRTAHRAVADAYLAAFAATTGATLVTFDQALANLSLHRRSPVLQLS
jgi:uncharacterized protein